jgi:hypothetical protein
VAAVFQQPDQSFAHERGVLGDHDPHDGDAFTWLAGVRR